MKLFLKINEYANYKLNEEIGDDSINSEENVKRDRLKDNIDYFNNNKNKLNSITGLDSNDWEEKANEIINGNKYLQLYWKYVKAQDEVNKLENKANGSDITEEEKNDINNDLDHLNDKMTKYYKDVNDKIKEDEKLLK